MDEKLNWLRLLRSENVGPVTFRYLIGRFGTAGAALAALPELAQRSGRRRLRVASLSEAERELDALQAARGTALALCEPGYPIALAAIEDAPPLLFLRGRPELLMEDRAVGVVGARNASGNGRLLAERFGRGLAAEHFTVVSGLARGIDTAAHQGALSAGYDHGSTIAVMAGGLDVVYPPENEGLADEIAGNGLLLSEMAIGTEPQARHFPRRNRLISGLSQAVLVVEAAERSGSLITARMANDQGRQVLAVPGSPLDPRAQGCNRLIRDGARLVQSLDDILEELGGGGPRGCAPTTASALFEAPEIASEIDDRAIALVLECLSPSPLAVDEVIRRCQLSPPLVQNVLLELELAGRLERQAGNRVALIA
ncbi:MAG TPA: DNA-processing protein DprA [Kiloniellales bacterium]|nr:DNA-processing protein DprA [Kiloniellales bacterium]